MTRRPDFRPDTDGKAMRGRGRERKVARTIIDGVGRRFLGRKATFFFSLRLTYAKRVRDGSQRSRRVDTSALLILFACNPSSHPRCRITKSSGGGFVRARRSVMLARVIEGDINARVYRFRVRLFTATLLRAHVVKPVRTSKRKREEDRASPRGRGKRLL